MAPITPSASQALGRDYAPPTIDDRAGKHNSGGMVHHNYFNHPLEIYQDRCELVKLIAESPSLKAYNSTGGDLAAGTLVYPSYDFGNTRWKWNKASAAPGSQATHVLPAAIANGNAGWAIKVATVTNLDTSGWTAAGDPVYLDTTAGQYTKTAPTGANQLVQLVGYVLVKHATTGSIGFWVEPAQKLGTDSLQDDSITSAKIVAEAVGTPEIADGAVTIEDKVSTAESDPTLVLMPDGAGGVEWVDPATLGLGGGVGAIALSADAEGNSGTNKIRFTGQVKDIEGNNFAGTFAVRIMISGSPGGPPDATFLSSVSLNKGTLKFTWTSNCDLLILTDTDGAFELDLVDTGDHNHTVHVECAGRYGEETGDWDP